MQRLTFIAAASLALATHGLTLGGATAEHGSPIEAEQGTLAELELLDLHDDIIDEDMLAQSELEKRGGRSKSRSDGKARGNGVGGGSSWDTNTPYEDRHTPCKGFMCGWSIGNPLGILLNTNHCVIACECLILEGCVSDDKRR